MSRVVLQSKDSVVLVGNFLSPEGATRAVLLFHMMPADHTSWQGVQRELEIRGIASLALDFRGHGGSTLQEGQTLDYRTFTDADHRKYLIDASEALHWLEIRGFTLDKIGLAGASIGANIALLLAVQNHVSPAVALLSPGQNYRGLNAFAAAEQLSVTQSLWMAASQGDDQESYEAAQEILRRSQSGQKMLVPFASSGHGTNLFHSHPELVGALADWFNAHIVA